MKEVKKLLILTLILAMAILSTACSAQKTQQENKSSQANDNSNSITQNEATKKVKIVTTLFPTYDFAKNIVGEKGEVTLLLHPGTEPHSYEPTPKDIITIEESDVFVYTGDNMEPWAKNLFENKEVTNFLIVNAGQNIPMMEHSHDHDADDEHEHHDHDHDAHDEHEHHDHDHDADDKHEHHEHDHDADDKHEHHEHDHDADDKHEHHEHDHDADDKHEHHEHDHDADDKHEHHHDGNDPHIWTDPVNAMTMVDNILAAIISADIENKEYYEKNAQAYKEKLHALDEEFAKEIKGKDLKIVYGGHFALGYMAKRYDFEFITAYEHFSPDAEPSAKKIAQLKDFVEHNHVKIIYHEEMLSPKIAQMIADSTGAKLLELSGIHNVSKEDFEKGIGYIDIMKKNLYNLKEGL